MEAKTELIIFGRSPFIDQVNMPALLKRCKTLGLNAFSQDYPVDYLVLFDKWLPHYFASHVIYPDGMKHCKGTPYIFEASETPIIGKVIDGKPILGFRFYSVSIAINWAIFLGFKKIYLVGIDHEETDFVFVHHGGRGIEGPQELKPETHQGIKRYVAECARHAEVFQCNPAVAADWPIPFMPVEELYVSYDDAVYYSNPDREDPIQNRIDTLKRRIDELDKVQVQLTWENVDLRDEIKHLKVGK